MWYVIRSYILSAEGLTPTCHTWSQEETNTSVRVSRTLSGLLRFNLRILLYKVSSFNSVTSLYWRILHGPPLCLYKVVKHSSVRQMDSWKLNPFEFQVVWPRKRTHDWRCGLPLLDLPLFWPLNFTTSSPLDSKLPLMYCLQYAELKHSRELINEL